MKINRKTLLIAAIGLTLICINIFVPIKKIFSSNTDTFIDIDPGFANYITGYTSGVISSNAVIKVRLNTDVADSTLIGKEATDLFDFSPSIDGKAYWTDAHTIEFRPTKPMKSGEFYRASFELSEVMDVSEDKFKVFEFGFMIIPLNFAVEFDGLKSNVEGTAYSLNGTIHTTDIVDETKLEQLLTYKLSTNDKATIKWDHRENIHTFSIGALKRTNDASVIIVNWNGNELDIDVKGSEKFDIPKLNDFYFLNVRVKNNPERTIIAQFSDPIDAKQDLNGLISFGGTDITSYVVNLNEISFFPPSGLTGAQLVRYNKAIKNFKGKELGGTIERTINLDDLKPSLKSVYSGNIIPTDKNEVIFPFEATNLKSVVLTVFQVPTENVGSFLQINDLDGRYDLKRVARPILYKTISLRSLGTADLSRWNLFSIDLSKFIKLQAGALYQINLHFGPSNLLNPCTKNEENLLDFSDNDHLNELNDRYDDPNSRYYYQSELYYYNSEDYDWTKREDPCNPAYYTENRFISSNILASNLGIIAKKGNDGTYFFNISSIITAQPLEGVEVTLYDYQLRPMAKVVTDNEGFGSFKMKRTAFIAIATKGEQKGYVKLDDASSLSISNFDVAGAQIQKGLKGFIYGDRGVWRPGDSLYVSFILEDKQQTLPKNHPVIFELRNPQGRITDRKVSNKSTGGIYTFKTFTRPESLTGNYTASVRVGGTYFEKNIRIETVKPNRLKINLDLGNQKTLRLTENPKAALQVRYLNGAIAGNLKAVYDVVLSKTSTEFKGYKGYCFDDPGKPFESQLVTMYDGRLDGGGNASFPIYLNKDIEAPGALNAIFKGKVFEPGGDFSIDNQTATIYPYSSFVGIKLPSKDMDDEPWLDIEKDQTIELATVNNLGQPLSRTDLKVEIYKLDWSWWWDADENNLANYINDEYYAPVFKTTINSSNGKARFNFKAKNDWGRYYIRVIDPESGHSTGKVAYFDFAYWFGRRSAEGTRGATLLSFTADKESYNVGEEISLSIPAHNKGSIIINIENGSTVLKSIRQAATAGTNLIRIKATPEMAPNVYLNVSVIQPHAEANNDVPIRQYGIVSIKVENPENKLAPIIEMPNELRPEQKVSIKVKEQKGKAMAYTLMVVDEGLLGLTGYKTPDPYNVFYAKEALGVKTWDIYDRVVGAYGGTIEKLLAIGGDGSLKPGYDQGQIRFKPVVKFFGPFYLDKGKTALHEFKMPNYVGEVRAMVIAASDGAYGCAEKSVTVKNPLMLLASFPRVIGPDEEVKLPVNVFNLERTSKTVAVQVKTNHGFNVIDKITQQVTVPAGQDRLVYFSLKANRIEGQGRIEILATNGKDKATEQIDVPVRNPNEMQTRVLDLIVEPGKTINQTIELIGLRGTNSAQLEFYSYTPINLNARLNQLLGYPHGCLEQTVSKAFPQLYITDIMEFSEDKKKEIQSYVNAAISKLSSFQRNDGAFSYWQGTSYYNDWTVSYAGHFMLEARNKGYQIPDELINKWINFQQTVSRNWNTKYYSNLSHAYRLYTLALASKPDLGAMNRLKENKNLNSDTRIMLAWAYSQVGQKDVAQALINNLNPSDEDNKNYYYETFGSPVRHMAIATQVFNNLGMKASVVNNLKQISSILNSSQWLSTQETALALMAVSKILSLKGEKSEGLKAEFNLNNTQKVVSKNGTRAEMYTLKIREGQNTVQIKNNAKNILFVKLIINGRPLPGQEQSFMDQLTVSVKYMDKKRIPIDIAELKQGTDFMAEVTISNPSIYGNYQHMALSQIFPSGWEIINTRLDGSNELVQSSQTIYEDIRDDRIYSYFDLYYRETKTFQVYLNASYLGKFYLPGVRCESMYSKSPSASLDGKWVNVTDHKRGI